MLLEIIGYWTPEYLVAKANTIAKFSQQTFAQSDRRSDRPPKIILSDRRSDRLPTDRPPEFSQCPILLAIPQQVQFDLPQRVFKKNLKPEDVLQRLGEEL